MSSTTQRQHEARISISSRKISLAGRLCSLYSDLLISPDSVTATLERRNAHEHWTLCQRGVLRLLPACHLGVLPQWQRQAGGYLPRLRGYADRRRTGREAVSAARRTGDSCAAEAAGARYALADDADTRPHFQWSWRSTGVSRWRVGGLRCQARDTALDIACAYVVYTLAAMTPMPTQGEP